MIEGKPYSGDPLEYDYSIHHAIFRSVLGGLVSNYSKNEIVPVIASSWTSSEDKKLWTFNIRDDLTFENGDKITAAIVKQSFCRMAFLQKQRDSNTGLLEYLEGYERIDSINNCDGLIADGGVLTFKLTKKIDNFLETISFGLFSIVHPLNFDANGKWKDDKKIISSSFYRIKDWNDSSLILDLREDFNLDVGHANKIKKLKVFWDAVEEQNPDIRMTSSFDPIPAGYRFVNGAESNIAFLRVVNWKSEASPLHKENVRKDLRDLFYRNLEKSGVKIVKSFFPLSINGVSELVSQGTKAPELDNAGLVFAPLNNKMGSFNESLILAAEESGLKSSLLSAEERFELLETDLVNYQADVIAMWTGILIDKPHDDIKFMFESKEGIYLPDQTGEILEVLKNDNFNVQKINELLFEQAIIWPITHFSDGIQIVESIDISHLNPMRPPIDFTFVGLK